MVINLACLVAACKKLKFKYKFYDSNHNLVGIIIKCHEYFFTNTATPFNTDSVGSIFSDKGYTYDILSTLGLVPKTISYLDPQTDQEYQMYVKDPTIVSIATSVQNNFSLPVIIKKNRGYKGINVFSCNSPEEIEHSLHTIFDKNSREYDYVALAQEKINIKEEYRVIVFRGKILLTYLKDNSDAKFCGNLSPLHWEGARAKVIDDQKLIMDFKNLVDKVNTNLTIGFAGLDIALDQNGKLWLIEINSRPGFDIFVRDNGQDRIIGLYEHILQRIEG